MSTVPPNSNDERDETPDRVAPETSTEPTVAPSAPPAAAEAPAAQTGAAEPPVPPETAGPERPATADASRSSAPGRTRTGGTDSDLAGAPSPEAPGTLGGPAAEPPAAPPVAPSPTETAPPTQNLGGAHAAGPVPAEEPATRQLPTEEEDEALRAERARRFGRVASSGAEPVEADRRDPAATGSTGMAAGAGAATGAATGAGIASTGEPEPTTTVATDTTETTSSTEDDPFADFDEGPTSRAAAHWWGILIAIVFGPVTWYLVTDGGERISYSLSQNLESVNVMGLVELGGGLITLIIMLMAARWSSVGSIIIGSITTLIGAAFLAVPQMVADFLSSQSMVFDRLGQFGTNIHDHLVSDGHSGRLLLYGVTFIFIGVISHGARRQGRREERRKSALEA